MDSLTLRSSKVWIELQSAVTAQHPSFFERLIKQYPTLTPKQVKLCALIIMGIEHDEAASLLDIEPHAYYTNRSNLRKLLTIDKGETLYNHLLRLANASATQKLL